MEFELEVDWEVYNKCKCDGSSFLCVHVCCYYFKFYYCSPITARSIMNDYFLPKTITELIELLHLIPHPEGGYFRETHRSGSVPMTSRGCTDTSTSTYPSRSLVKACNPNVFNRENNNSSNDATDNANDTQFDFVARNALTSIYWVPTITSPKIQLVVNLSDHVHYYQGGGYAFIYYIYEPQSTTLRVEILGPNLLLGHQLQVCVRGGDWKCGRIVSLDTSIRDVDVSSDMLLNVSAYDALPSYVVIGEAVGPGFDVNDFCWITSVDVMNSKATIDAKNIMKSFLHHDSYATENKNQDFDKYYDATL